MTDEFEQAVRRAAQGLTNEVGAGQRLEQPTYHDAWQRGRRRRFRKQAGIAVAGAFVVFAALTVNLGDLGDRGSDVSEVATEAQATVAATSPEFVPTTPPIVAPPQAVPSAAADASATQPSTSGAEALTEQAPAVEATPTPPAAAAAAPDEPAQSTPVPPIAAAPEEADESPTVAAVADPTPVVPSPTEPPAAAAQATDVETTPPTTTFDAAVTPTPGDGATAQTVPVDPEGERTPEPAAAGLPNVTFIGPNQPADAIVLDAATDGPGVPCDIDGDGTADAACTLMPSYGCADSTEAKPGYLAIDLDEDGEFDRCVAVDTTACDTTGDGLADTPCTIELGPAELDRDEP